MTKIFFRVIRNLVRPSSRRRLEPTLNRHRYETRSVGNTTQHTKKDVPIAMTLHERVTSSLCANSRAVMMGELGKPSTLIIEMVIFAKRVNISCFDASLNGIAGEREENL